MNELNEVCKYVQYLIQGLFLRYYLLIALKDKLHSDDSLVNDGDGDNEMNNGANEESGGVLLIK